jgi:predicted transcriptional regulator
VGPASVRKNGRGPCALKASPARLEICELLQKGVNHPEDLAKRLKVSRQSIDEHLLALHGKGVVDRSAVFPTDGKPKVVYAVSAAAKEFMDGIEESLKTYIMTRLNEYQDSLVVLDDDLASGRLDEEAYLKRRERLETHHGDFLEQEHRHGARRWSPVGR